MPECSVGRANGTALGSELGTFAGAANEGIDVVRAEGAAVGGATGANEGIDVVRAEGAAVGGEGAAEGNGDGTPTESVCFT